jgi:hypothetical protein
MQTVASADRIADDRPERRGSENASGAPDDEDAFVWIRRRVPVGRSMSAHGRPGVCERPRSSRLRGEGFGTCSLARRGHLPDGLALTPSASLTPADSDGHWPAKPLSTVREVICDEPGGTATDVTHRRLVVRLDPLTEGLPAGHYRVRHRTVGRSHTLRRRASVRRLSLDGTVSRSWTSGSRRSVPGAGETETEPVECVGTRERAPGRRGPERAAGSRRREIGNREGERPEDGERRGEVPRGQAPRLRRFVHVVQKRTDGRR